MNEYLLDLGDDNFVEVPKDIQYEIIQDKLMTTYYWSIGFFSAIVGFLLGIIATK